MRKKLNTLIKYLVKFAVCKNKRDAAKYLLILFEDINFDDIPTKKQIIILNNLIQYFEELIAGIENINGVVYYTIKNQNKHFISSDIQRHLVNKLHSLINYNYTLYV